MNKKSASDMTETNLQKFTRFGFRFPFGSPHVSRTMMLAELTRLIDCVGDPDALKKRYLDAVVKENCLSKRTGKNRLITKKYLVELYSLDIRDLLFRALLYFWRQDPDARPLLALTCACARDPLLRTCMQYILPLPEGTKVSTRDMERFLNERDPDRYSPATLASITRNLKSTWTQSGHLSGRSLKIRTKAVASAGSVSYALLLGYLKGHRGFSLFQTELVKLLDCPFDRAAALAEASSRKGWIVCNRIGDVIDVQFPNLINEKEMEWLREQG